MDVHTTKDIETLEDALEAIAGPRESRVGGCGVGTLSLHEGAYIVFTAFTWSPDTVWLLIAEGVGGSWLFWAC